MAQEGISTLPQSPENQASSGEKIPFSQDLENTKAALAKANPEYVPAYEQGMEQVISQLNLPIEELNVLKQILEYLLQNEAEYPKLRQRLINEAGVRPEDIPEEFDRGYLMTMLVVVQEALSRKQGMGGSMPEPQGFQKGGLAGAAEALRQQGRGGDTILAHINPQEAKLLKAMGGSGTINPATGIMEFKGGGGGILGGVGKAIGGAFSAVGNAVKSVVSSPVGKIVATVALTAALGPGGLALGGTLGAGAGLAATAMAYAIPAAIAGSAISLAGGSNLSTALKTGLISGGLAGLAPGISNFLPGTGGYLNAAATGAILGGGYGALTGQNIAKSALTGGLLGGVLSAAGGAKAFGPAQPTVSPTDTSFSQGMREYGGSAPDTSGGISTLPSGQTNLQAPTPDYDFTGLSAEARTPTFDIGFGPDRFSPPPAADTSFSQGMSEFGGPAQARAPLTDTSLSQGMSEFGGGPTQAAGQKGPLTDTSLSQGMREYGGGGPNQPSSTGIGSYFDKAKNYLFSSDPSNPGFFYNSKGEISVPAVVGTVIAGGALMDGFKPAPVTPPGMINKNVTGETLIERDPNKYIVGGIPGYNAPPPSTAYAGYVPTPSYGPGNNPSVYPVYTPPGMAATARPNQGIMQPYNYNPYTFAPFRAAKGGITRAYPRKTGSIDGPGTGTSDSIPAMLSDGEFVITAKAVRGAGGGSRREGAKKLYRMMHALEKKAGGKV
jgi:hypothetical protein